MKFSSISGIVAILLSLAFSGLVSGYSLSDIVIGSDFYDFFTWEAISDPTHGRVNYVDKATSIDSNLTYASSNTFILRADHTSVLDHSDSGRDSVRIKSKKVYKQHVAVFDIRHMPQGCGTWPAIWETKGSNWPTGGEVDIVEGVNDQSPNTMTLHSTSGCTMPDSDSRRQTGAPISSNCDSFANNNQGCSVRAPTANSYGPSFNRIGGGWYAVERSSNSIKVWFWARVSDYVPSDIAGGSSTVNPKHWGTPTAYFPDTFCDIDNRFQEHNIIINLTFCGDWAGSVYAASGCPSSCEDFVNSRPSAFKNAYFDFASIRVYDSDIPNVARPSAHYQTRILTVMIKRKIYDMPGSTQCSMELRSDALASLHSMRIACIFMASWKQIRLPN